MELLKFNCVFFNWTVPTLTQKTSFFWTLNEKFSHFLLLSLFISQSLKINFNQLFSLFPFQKGLWILLTKKFLMPKSIREQQKYSNAWKMGS